LIDALAGRIRRAKAMENPITDSYFSL